MLLVFPLEEKDIPAVVEIENRSFSAPKSEAIFRDERNKYIVAREGEEVLGYIGIERVADEFHIINMAVHPDHRRKKIGEMLLKVVLNDHDMFYLEVRASNIAAQELYKKFGFEKVGIRKNYYSDNDEDAYIMRRQPR
jgi:ribosomal-protein-alanine N-acetyltransferase